MRIFAIRFHSQMLIEVLKKLQERDKSVEVVYWEGTKSHFENLAKNKPDLFRDAIFHLTEDAVIGLPAYGVDVSQFPPVGKVLVNALLECESQVLTMMNTVDLDNNIPLSKKKNIYYSYIKYWHGILVSLKPDAILFGDIPHLSVHYVIYCIAKMLGIRTITFKAIKIGGRVIFLDDLKDYKNLRLELEKAKGRNFKVEDLSSDVQEHYKKQTNPHIDNQAFYTKKQYLKQRATPYHLPKRRVLTKHIRSRTFLSATSDYVKMFFHKRTIPHLEKMRYSGAYLWYKEYGWSKIKKRHKEEYEKSQSNPDFSKKYIYVALHNQPECSTSAMGDIFVDQILMIDILSASIPHDWRLYIKESPLQWSGPRTHTGRYRGYYEEISKRKNVQFVPVGTSTFELIEKSQAVASVTGSANWEAIVRGKPALAFGHVWYMYCDGVFRVSDGDSCKVATEKIRNGYKPDKQQVLNFLAAVDRASVRGFPNRKFKEGYNLDMTYEENIKNITEGFYQELQKK